MPLRDGPLLWLLKLAITLLNIRGGFKALKPLRPSRRAKAVEPARPGQKKALTARERVRRTAVKEMLMSWVVWVLFLKLEEACDATVAFLVPLYAELKLLSVGMILLWRTTGAVIVWERAVAPTIAPYEPVLNPIEDVLVLLSYFLSYLPSKLAQRYRRFRSSPSESVAEETAAEDVEGRGLEQRKASGRGKAGAVLAAGLGELEEDVKPAPPSRIPSRTLRPSASTSTLRSTSGSAPSLRASSSHANLKASTSRLQDEPAPPVARPRARSARAEPTPAAAPPARATRKGKEKAETPLYPDLASMELHSLAVPSHTELQPKEEDEEDINDAEMELEVPPGEASTPPLKMLPPPTNLDGGEGPSFIAPTPAPPGGFRVSVMAASPLRKPQPAVVTGTPQEKSLRAIADLSKDLGGDGPLLDLTSLGKGPLFTKTAAKRPGATSTAKPSAPTKRRKQGVDEDLDFEAPPPKAAAPRRAASSRDLKATIKATSAPPVKTGVKRSSTRSNLQGEPPTKRQEVGDTSVAGEQEVVAVSREPLANSVQKADAAAKRAKPKKRVIGGRAIMEEEVDGVPVVRRARP